MEAVLSHTGRGLGRVTRASASALLRAQRGEASAACPRCGLPGAYGLRDGRFRCRGCRYTFQEFAGTWLGRVKLPPEYWLALLRHFAEGVPVDDMARRLLVSYATAFKACHTVRLAVLAESAEDAALLLDERGEAVSFCPNLVDDAVQMHCVECRSPVFRVSQDETGVSVRLLPQAKARDVFGMDLPLKTWRTLLYTGSFRGHDGLVFSCCKRARTTFGHKCVEEALPLDRPGGFMDFAEPWMARYHCLSPQTYYLYLKEIELRFNNRERDLVSVLARKLVRPAPHSVPNSRD